MVGRHVAAALRGGAGRQGGGRGETGRGRVGQVHLRPMVVLVHGGGGDGARGSIVQPRGKLLLNLQQLFSVILVVVDVLESYRRDDGL